MSSIKKQLNATQRNLVVDLVQQGKSYRNVQKITGILVPTIQKIMKKYKTHGVTSDLCGRGRKRKTTERMDREICAMVRDNRFKSARQISEITKKRHNITLSSETVRRRLREAGFKSCIPRRKPFLTTMHMKRRLEFAKKYKDMPLSFWKKVLWTDELKFNLKSSDGSQKVWRKPGETYKLSCVRPTVKYGGGNVMVWGSMAWSGVGKLAFIDSRMDSNAYINILEENLKSSARKLRLGTNFIFMQDNDPKHRSKATTQYLENKHINVLEWPSQSPDLNRIEYLWNLLDQKVGERFFSKPNELKERMVRAWGDIDLNHIKNLVESMPRRLSDVIKTKGGPTKY